MNNYFTDIYLLQFNKLKYFMILMNLFQPNYSGNNKNKKQITIKIMLNKKNPKS